MELVFLIVLVALMAAALASGYPVAFALPGSAIITILLATLTGYIFTGDVTSYFAHGGPSEWLNSGVTNFRGVYWDPDRDTLIAIPLFVFMGIMLERSKIAEDLLVTMTQMFGRVPGGLGISVVVVGALLAATTGIVGATVIAMGLISLPVMLKAKYSKALATGTISASGTLGQIIPPSIVLIILADQLSNATDQALNLRKADYKLNTGSSLLPTDFGLTSASAGDMFLGAMLPGLVLVVLYILFILAVALIRPKLAPPVPHEGRFDLAFLRRVFVVLIPPLTLIFVVLGSILLGIATVNQAGAIGATGATIMAGYRLRAGTRGAYYPAILAVLSLVAIGVIVSLFSINIKNIRTSHDALGVTLAAIAVGFLLISLLWSGWRVFKINDTLRYVMVETAKTTSLVFIILLGAAMLTAAFRAFGGEELVRDFLSGLPGGFIAKFALVMAVIFILGFFLDFIEIAVVVVPIIAPILLADPSANVTAVWLGVMIGVNIQTSFLTPPFGFALFYLRGVAPKEVKTTDIYRGVIPFILLQLGALGVVWLYPTLVNYLPNRIYLGSENAPPPRNPRLQRCIEERNFVIYEKRGDEIRAAITRASNMDLSMLPENRQRDLTNSFRQAQQTFPVVAEVRAADAALEAYIPAYEPLHRRVRAIQREAHAIDAEIKERELRLRRLTDNPATPKATISDLERQIADLKARHQRTLAAVPSTWRDARNKYVDLAKKERFARLKYRRTVDNAYEPILETKRLIAHADQLAAQRKPMEDLGSSIATGDPAKVSEAAVTIERALRSVAGTDQIRSELSQIRRALRGNSPNRERARRSFDEAMKRFASELDWRPKAKVSLLPRLNAYDEAIRSTIGLRLQRRLNSEQAADVATCLSEHRDISLNF